MSYKALSKDNDLIFIKFDTTADLIIELIFMLLDRNTRGVNVNNVINDNIKNELNNYQLTFDVPTETKIQDEIYNTLPNKIKPPTPPPPYSPPPLLTINKTKTEKERLNKDQLDASNDAADQKKSENNQRYN